MPVQPLFISDMATLRSQIKLSGAMQPDTEVAIESATRRVRGYIYERLGSDRVVQILGYTSSENPTSTNDLARSRAEIMEADWVKLILMQDLPVLFMDASDNTSQVWNTEELTREARPSELDKRIAALQEMIDDAIDSLIGADRVGKVAVISTDPDTEPYRPGDSVRYPSRLRKGIIL